MLLVIHIHFITLDLSVDESIRSSFCRYTKSVCLTNTMLPAFRNSTQTNQRLTCWCVIHPITSIHCAQETVHQFQLYVVYGHEISVNLKMVSFNFVALSQWKLADRLEISHRWAYRQNNSASLSTLRTMCYNTLLPGMWLRTAAYCRYEEAADCGDNQIRTIHGEIPIG